MDHISGQKGVEQLQTLPFLDCGYSRRFPQLFPSFLVASSFPEISLEGLETTSADSRRAHG